MGTDLLEKKSNDDVLVDEVKENENEKEIDHQQPKKKRMKKKKYRTRRFPIWLRIIVVLILLVVCLVLGLMVGYSVIGDGSPTEVLQKQTWQHIIDIVTKE